MKRVIGIIIVGIFMLPFFAFGGRDKVEATRLQVVTVVGQIGVYGNEPHTWLGFVDQKGVEYTLEATTDILQELWKLQGIILEITGELDSAPVGRPVDFQNLSGGVIYVEEFKPHTPET